MRKLLIVTFVLFAFISARGQTGAGKKMELQSPDKRLKLTVELGKNTFYAVQFKDKPVILPSEISMTLDKMEMGKAVQIKKTKTNKKTGYNELIISATGYDIVFRAYNEGVAYRFITHLKDSVKVLKEQATFNLAGKPTAILQETDNYTVWEGVYVKTASTDELPEGKRATTPALFDHKAESVKVVIAESDVLDYPGMYIQKNKGQFIGDWAKYPSKTVMGSWGDFVSVVKEREDLLAKTIGGWQMAGHQGG